MLFPPSAGVLVSRIVTDRSKAAPPQRRPAPSRLLRFEAIRKRVHLRVSRRDAAAGR